MKLLVVCLLCCGVALAVDPEILKFNESVNVLVGSSVHYSCTGVGDNILYIVNNSVASNFIDDGFSEQVGQDTLSDDIRRRSMTLTSATIDLNNTDVQCRISVINPSSNKRSNISTLRVQGLLGTVDSFYINTTSLTVTWSAPYTLDGVPILGYNITITNTSNGNILYTNFTQDTQFAISDPCAELTLTISGYNGAGDGEASSFNFSHPGAGSLTHILHALEANLVNETTVEVALNLSVTALCPGQYPSGIMGSLYITGLISGTQYHNNITLSLRVINSYKLILKNDTRYDVDIELYNSNGSVETISQVITKINAQQTITSTAVMTTTPIDSTSTTITGAVSATMVAPLPADDGVDTLPIIVGVVGALVVVLLGMCVLIGAILLCKQFKHHKDGIKIRQQAIANHDLDYDRNPSYDASSMMSPRPSITQFPNISSTTSLIQLPSRPLPDLPDVQESKSPDVTAEYDDIKIYLEITDKPKAPVVSEYI